MPGSTAVPPIGSTAAAEVADTATFGASNILNPVVPAGGVNLRTMTFSSAAGNYVLSGGPITFAQQTGVYNGGFTINGGTQTIQNNLLLPRWDLNSYALYLQNAAATAQINVEGNITTQYTSAEATSKYLALTHSSWVPGGALSGTISGAITEGSTGKLNPYQYSGFWSLTNNANNFSGGYTLTNGVLRLSANAASLPAASNIIIGGILETSGTFYRVYGGGAGQYQMNNYNNLGFSAYGGKLTVDLAKTGTSLQGTRDDISWGTAYSWGNGTREVFAMFNTQNIAYDTSSADNAVEFYDNLNLNGGTDAGVMRGFAVGDNGQAANRNYAQLSGNVTGTGGILKVGRGRLVLSGANTYNGDTYIRNGTVEAQSNSGLGTGTMRVGDNVTAFNARVATTAAVGTTAATFDAATHTVTFGVAVTAIDGQTLAAGDRVLVKDGITVSGSSGTRYNGIYQVIDSTHWQRTTDFDQAAAGEIAAGARVSVTSGTANGGKAWSLYTTNTSGNITLNTSTLPFYRDLSSPTSDVAVLASGARTIANNIIVTNNLASTGNSTIGGSTADVSSFTGTVTLNKNVSLTAASGGRVNFTNTIDDGAGSFALNKIGAGIVSLTGANTYDGGTTVSAGTLLANNASGSATGSGLVSVAEPGILGGTGSILGNVSLAADGADIDTIGATLVIGTATDPLAIGGNLTLGTGAALDLTGISGLDPTLSYTLVNYGGALSGMFGSVTNQPATHSLFLGSGSNDAIRLVPIHLEPAALGLLAAGLLLCRRRRR